MSTLLLGHQVLAPICK